jgi:hypothetical protein
VKLDFFRRSRVGGAPDPSHSDGTVKLTCAGPRCGPSDQIPMAPRSSRCILMRSLLQYAVADRGDAVLYIAFRAHPALLRRSNVDVPYETL